MSERFANLIMHGFTVHLDSADHISRQANVASVDPCSARAGGETRRKSSLYNLTNILHCMLCYIVLK